MIYKLCPECLARREEVFGKDERETDTRNIKVWCIHKYEEEKERVKKQGKKKKIN